MQDFAAVCEREKDWIVRFARDFASHESPSTDRPALERCGLWLARQLADLGGTVTRPSGGAGAGDHVLARWAGRQASVLVIGHYDTVWPVGQVGRMPIHEEDGKLFGPGVLDMKAGVAIAALAVRTLMSAKPESTRPAVTLLVTSDEEVGSASSRALIEQLAREHAAALVVEPALPGGAVKTSRKGVADFELIAHGVSSHAGADPGAGASAIHELARQIVAAERLANPARGISITAGVIEGGTRSNVVAERASARIDVRVSFLDDAATITKTFAHLRPENPRVRLEVRGGFNRPPMERTAGVARLYDIARKVAREMGRELGEGMTGGASDGNFTAALGVPTLDGLGAIGDGPHALHEHVVVSELPARAALLAGLMARIGTWDN